MALTLNAIKAQLLRSSLPQQSQLTGTALPQIIQSGSSSTLMELSKHIQRWAAWALCLETVLQDASLQDADLYRMASLGANELLAVKDGHLAATQLGATSLIKKKKPRGVSDVAVGDVVHVTSPQEMSPPFSGDVASLLGRRRLERRRPGLDDVASRDVARASATSPAD
ncbi:hypothetical protein MUK42_28628 [Musa troglodytarum]|uniref:Uncharacterized protein n=1 Tax=Musa troglodytarum TaxID=320322 RepID=A0A9E7FJM5_9LILI|nr:hypothetical protein MUK42_28628 [Musa troglodytarum]